MLYGAAICRIYGLYYFSYVKIHILSLISCNLLIIFYLFTPGVTYQLNIAILGYFLSY